jgi:hypothetical protein
MKGLNLRTLIASSPAPLLLKEKGTGVEVDGKRRGIELFYFMDGPGNPGDQWEVGFYSIANHDEVGAST